MKTLHSYEDWGVQRPQPRCVRLESFKGEDIVAWWGNIERQLQRMLEENEASRNFPYADKIREFLRIWREHAATGSINRESLEVVQAAADILAVDTWNQSNYFSNLRDRVRVLIASEEALPRVEPEAGAEGAGIGPGGAGTPGGGLPPVTPEFGPEEEPPKMGGLDQVPPGEEDKEDEEEE